MKLTNYRRDYETRVLEIFAHRARRGVKRRSCRKFLPPLQMKLRQFVFIDSTTANGNNCDATEERDNSENISKYLRPETTVFYFLESRRNLMLVSVICRSFYVESCFSIIILLFIVAINQRKLFFPLTIRNTFSLNGFYYSHNSLNYIFSQKGKK